MTSGQKVAEAFVQIAQDDLEQFLKDIDCIDLVKKFREDGLATCIAIPSGETFTTVCEKMRQVAFSPGVREQIKKYLNSKVEAVIMANRMSVSLSWLGTLLDEARVTEDTERKNKLDDFLKQFFEHVDKLTDEIKDSGESTILAQALKMSQEDIPNATAALHFYPQIRNLFNESTLRNDAPSMDYSIDDSVWIHQLISCAKRENIDLYPYHEVLEMSQAQVQMLILQKQESLMKECRVFVNTPQQCNTDHVMSPDKLPTTFYSSDHLKPSEIAPIELPPLDVFPGDHVYCFERINYPWKQWSVLRVSRETLTLYDPEDDSKQRETKKQDVATAKNVATEGLWLPVGSLIVAWFDDGATTTPFGHTEKYCHGIVIEGPCIWNRFRYMVFFEKGDIRYVRPDFVCRRLRQWGTREDVGDANVSQMSDLMDPLNFLKKYFELWPRRPFVMADVGQTLSCSYYGKMQNFVVEEIDCSLFRVRLCDNSRQSEWIHRGSRRFEIMEHYLVSDLLETGGTGQQARPHRIKWTSATVEVAHWKLDGPVNSEQEMLPNDDTFGQTRNIFRKHKPVAKKSSVPGLIQPRMPRRKRAKSPPSARSREEGQGSLINEIFSTRRNGRPEGRRPYSVHVCSSSCVDEEESNFFDRSGTKGRNPLGIPLECGWFRQIPCGTQPAEYTTPCGLARTKMTDIEDYLIIVGSRLTIDMFSLDRELDVQRKFSTSKPVVTLPDISEGVEPHQPLPFVNKFSNETANGFKYTNQFTTSSKIVSFGNQPEYLAGCDCRDGCRNSKSCFCRRLTSTTAGSAESGYKYCRLPHLVPTGIYECNSKCQCSCNPSSCANRVAQRGLRVRVQVFKTEDKGWGVQTIDDLPAGQFLCIYSGEILTSQEADVVGNQQGDEFLYDLDFLDVAIRHKQHDDDAISDVSSETSGSEMEICTVSNTAIDSGNHQEAYSASLVRLYHGTADNYSFVMDAKRYGNLSRFFNHSCDPNLIVQNVFIDTHDLRLPVIGFFTARRIRAGEELTWDYSYEPGSVPGRIIQCKCNTDNCRGRLL